MVRPDPPPLDPPSFSPPSFNSPSFDSPSFDPLPLDWFTADDSVVSVALVFPLQGAAGIFGPTCELCARLAAEQVNRSGGVLGKELRLLPVDGGAEPRRVAENVEALVSLGIVQGVTGWHISSVRQALAPRIAHRVPYVYTALYEGGERTAGVFLTSETPDAQLQPAMGLLAREHRVRRWFVVGNDYVWPRRTARAAHRYARASGGEVCAEAYLPLGTHDFDAVLRRVERSEADGVLMLLVGSDAVRFNRAFAAAGLDGRCLRLSTLMDENMLMASGPAATMRPLQHGRVLRLPRQPGHTGLPRPVRRTVRRSGTGARQSR